jgi:hypothetical protein
MVGTLVKAHDPVQKVTLIPRGQAQGLTWFTPSEEQMPDFSGPAPGPHHRCPGGTGR